MNGTKVWRGLSILSILIFIISVAGIGILSYRYVRDPAIGVYGFTGGSGQLWLLLIAISSLQSFVISYYEGEQHNRSAQ